MQRTTFFFSTVAILLSVQVQAQVRIKPQPEQGYEQRIRDFVDRMKVVDTHEHLANPLDIPKGSDFTRLFLTYPHWDLGSGKMLSGSPMPQLKPSMTPMEKWQFLKPYWEASFNTAFNRAALVAADGLYGVKSLDASTVEELSARMNAAYRDPVDWYHCVLREKCGIEYIVNDWRREERRFDDPTDTFRFVRRFDAYDNNFVFIRSAANLQRLAKSRNVEIRTLDDLVRALDAEFRVTVDKGIVAVKSALAYDRPLSFDSVRKEKAEEVFNRIVNSADGTGLPFSEAKPLQDYMMRRVLDCARAHHLPVQIHTGYQIGSGYFIEYSKPTLLANLFREYRDVPFVLFHGAYPYGGELATLAKGFGNVHIDLCWLYIISPSYAERYLHEWLETVPASKIMAFGGDAMHIECTYAQLMFAKQIVANVLIAKVRDGYFSEDEAKRVAQMILHDNAIRIYNLKKATEGAP